MKNKAKKDAPAKRKVGRPAKVNWNSVNLLWKNNTDRALSDRLGCTVVNVFLKRRKLVAKAQVEGKDGSFFICKLPKWTRTAKKVVEVPAQSEVAVEPITDNVPVVVVDGIAESAVA